MPRYIKRHLNELLLLRYGQHCAVTVSPLRIPRSEDPKAHFGKKGSGLVARDRRSLELARVMEPDAAEVSAAQIRAFEAGIDKIGLPEA